MNSYLDELNETILRYNRDDTIRAEGFGIDKLSDSIYTIKLPAYSQSRQEAIRLSCETLIPECGYAVVYTSSEFKKEENRETTHSVLRLQFDKDNKDQYNKLMYLKSGKWNNLGSLIAKCDIAGKYSKVLDDSVIYPIVADYSDRDCTRLIGVEKKFVTEGVWINFYCYSRPKYELWKNR
jgi:hypothetical protein